jgi:hypothetical protein
LPPVLAGGLKVNQQVSAGFEPASPPENYDGEDRLKPAQTFSGASPPPAKAGGKEERTPQSGFRLPCSYVSLKP